MDPFLTSRVVSDILLGATQGMLYGLVALSLVLVWRSTGILNFAQGAMPMFATYLGMVTLSRWLGFWPCAAVSLVVGLAVGGLTERTLVRPLYGKPEINPIVVMVGFLVVLEAVAAAIWSTNPRGLASPFSYVDFQLGGHPVKLSDFSVFTIVSALVVMGLIAALFRFTRLGLQLRASAVAPEVSKLLGVRVGRMLTLGWMISTGVGVVTTILVATQNFYSGLTPSVMDAIFPLGFVAAAVGGLDSPVGAIVSGVGLGIGLEFASDYWSTNSTTLVALGVLVVSLLARPNGIFTPNRTRRV